jgi:hypothetical protein
MSKIFKRVIEYKEMYHQCLQSSYSFDKPEINIELVLLYQLSLTDGTRLKIKSGVQ